MRTRSLPLRSPLEGAIRPFLRTLAKMGAEDLALCMAARKPAEGEGPALVIILNQARLLDSWRSRSVCGFRELVLYWRRRTSFAVATSFAYWALERPLRTHVAAY